MKIYIVILIVKYRIGVAVTVKSIVEKVRQLKTVN